MQFFDSVALGDSRVTADGYLVADARISRTGIQVYAGREVGRPDLDQVRVYRPAAEVFSADAMRSAAHRPVTNDHPTEAVSAANWRSHSVGMTGGDVARDGQFIRVPMVVMDQAAIDHWKAGKRELSAGYTTDLKWEPGRTDDGQSYDAIQTNIRLNHLAIVGAGRAGSDCRLGDGQGFTTPQGGRHMALKTIIVDGLPVETTDAGEAAVNKLRGMLADAATAMTKAETDHNAAVAAKDVELGTKDAEITDLKSKVVTGAALDALVGDRAAVLAKAKAVAPTLDTAGKSNADIRRAAVAAKLGDEKVKDRSDDYVGALFDHLTGDTKAGDPVRDALSAASTTTAVADGAKAHHAMVNDLGNAWKGEQKEAR